MNSIIEHNLIERNIKISIITRILHQFLTQQVSILPKHPWNQFIHAVYLKNKNKTYFKVDRLIYLMIQDR